MDDRGGPVRVELTEQTRQRLREERAALRTQREQLRGDAAQDNRAADSGERAEAMRRADDVFRLDDRIREINRLLTAPQKTYLGEAGRAGLAEGSIVRNSPALIPRQKSPLSQ